MDGGAGTVMEPQAPTRMAAAPLAPVKVLSITCEDEPSAEIAVKASSTTWPAVKALASFCCWPGCRSKSR